MTDQRHRGVAQVAVAYRNVRARLRSLDDIRDMPGPAARPKEFIGKIEEIHVHKSDPLAHTIGGAVLTGKAEREITVKARGSMGEVEIMVTNGIPAGWDPRGQLISFRIESSMSAMAEKIHLGGGVIGILMVFTYDTWRM